MTTDNQQDLAAYAIRLGDDADIEALIRAGLSELAPVDAHVGST